VRFRTLAACLECFPIFCLVENALLYKYTLLSNGRVFCVCCLCGTRSIGDLIYITSRVCPCNNLQMLSSQRIFHEQKIEFHARATFFKDIRRTHTHTTRYHFPILLASLQLYITHTRVRLVLLFIFPKQSLCFCF
jgi:hypothetical protein